MKQGNLCKAMTDRISVYFEQANNVHANATPETIHDFRVASRYLIAIEPLLRQAGATTKWRGKLKCDMKSLTLLRDLQVFRKRFDGRPELSKLTDLAIDHELDKTAALRNKVGGKSFANNIHASLHAFCSSKQTKSEFDRLIYKLWMKHWNRLNQALETTNFDDPISIHKLRIRFKPFRYLSSFLHESQLVSISSFDAFKQWQDLMGDVNDLEVVCRWLEQQSGYENLVRQLDHEATLLRQKLGNEKHDFHAFIRHINTTVLNKLAVNSETSL